MSHGVLPFIGLLFLVGVVVLVVKSVLASKKAPATTFPYQKEPHLFTPAERSFLGVLEQAVGTQSRVLGKVRLADVIKVSGVNGTGRQSAFNRIQSKHVDFVVCSANDLAVQSVVELDDQSHDRPTRQSRDEFLDKALQAAGVPLFHFSAKRSYTVADVKKALAATESIAARDTRPVVTDDKTL